MNGDGVKGDGVSDGVGDNNCDGGFGDGVSDGDDI